MYVRRLDEIFGSKESDSIQTKNVISPPETANNELNAGQSIYSVRETRVVRPKPSFLVPNLTLSMTHSKINNSVTTFPNSARNNYTAKNKIRNSNIGESTDFESVG